MLRITDAAKSEFEASGLSRWPLPVEPAEIGRANRISRPP